MSRRVRHVRTPGCLRAHGLAARSVGTGRHGRRGPLGTRRAGAAAVVIVTPDASVLLKCVLPDDDEPDGDAALSLRDEAVAGAVELVVPAFSESGWRTACVASRLRPDRGAAGREMENPGPSLLPFRTRSRSTMPPATLSRSFTAACSSPRTNATWPAPRQREASRCCGSGTRGPAGDRRTEAGPWGRRALRCFGLDPPASVPPIPS